MAEIELRIVATDADDLRETLARLLGEDTYDRGSVAEMLASTEGREQDFAELAAAHPEGVPEAGERKRRGRPAKAAEAQSAAQGNTTSASATSASAASLAPSASSQTQPGSQSSAGKAPDPFGDQIKQVVAEAKAEEAAATAGPTSDDIQAAALAFSMAKSMVEAQKVLMSFTAENGDPVKTIKQVQPKDYAAVLAALQV